MFKGDWTCHLSCGDEKILPDDGALHKEMRKDPDGFDPDEEEVRTCRRPWACAPCAYTYARLRTTHGGWAGPMGAPARADALQRSGALCHAPSSPDASAQEKWCGFFSGLTIVDAEGKPKEYRLEVQEDAVWEAAQGPKTTYKAPEQSSVATGPKTESCSCIEGNPCADAYCCKDWKNRFEVAKKHGWKGFS